MSDYGRGGDYGGTTPPSQGDGYNAGGFEPPPTVRFEIIGEAWGLLKDQMGTWVLTTLVMGAVVFAIEMAVMVGLFASGAMRMGMPAPSSSMLMTVGVSCLEMIGIQLVMSFLVAGYYGMALKQLRGEQISVGDLFGGGKVYLPMFFYQVVIGLVLGVPMNLMMIPVQRMALEQHEPMMMVGAWLFAMVIYMLLGAGLMLGPLLIIDQRETGPIAAARASWVALKSNLLPAALFYFVLSLVAIIGFIGCGVGLLFTAPLLPLGLALLYRDFFGLPTQNTGNPGYPGGPGTPWATPPGGYSSPSGYPQPGGYSPPSAPPQQDRRDDAPGTL